MREFVFKYVMHSQVSYQDVWLVPGFCDPLLITLNPTEYQTHRLTEQNSALSNLQANYDFTRSVSQSGCPAVSSEFRCDCTFKNLLSQQIRPRKLWNYTTAKNFQPKRANDIHRRGICCDSGDKKLSLSNNDEAPSDEVSAPLDLSDALRVLTSRRESGACSVDTQHRGGGIGSEFCLGVDASVWAVQSCCCCCWSQAGQSTPGHLTATEGGRGVCFQINKKCTLKLYF